MLLIIVWNLQTESLFVLLSTESKNGNSASIGADFKEKGCVVGIWSGLLT
jgi:hypothetical protein